MSGLYSILVIVYEGDNVVGKVSIENRQLRPTFLTEFTPSSMDEYGKQRRFKIFDNTAYTQGMDTLALLAAVNGEAVQHVTFPSAIGSLRMAEIVVPFYKSLVLEFDTARMRNRMLV